MSLLDKLKNKSESIRFVKTVDRSLPPFHTDLLTLPVTNGENYSKVINEGFWYQNEICISGAFYDDLDTLGQEDSIIKNRDSADKDYLADRAKKAEQEGSALIKFCAGASKWTHSSPKEQLKFIKEYLVKATSFVPWFTFIISVGNYLEKSIEEAIVQQIGDRQKAKIVTLCVTTPNRRSLHDYEEDDFLELALKYQSGQQTDKLVDQHIKKYGFIGFRDGYGKFWTKEDIVLRLQQNKKPLSIKATLAEGRRKSKLTAKLTLNRLKPNLQLLRHINLAKQYVWLRTYRSDVYSQAFAMISKVINRYVQSLGYKDGDYLQFSVDDFLRGRTPNKKELRCRKQAFATIVINGKTYHLSGQSCVKFQLFLDSKVKHSKIVRGTVASKSGSKVTGPVKIDITPEDLNKVEVGDIIVSTMTTPNFTSAMKIAAGFVTDEGGILCHAALLSREMGKPCIVGTKNATKILKDFDRVEMDLESGRVRKL